MILEEICKQIELNEIAVYGEDLFIGDLPNKPANCLGVIAVPSPTPDKSIPVYEQTVDVWSRSKKSETAYSQLEQIKDLFHQQANYTIGDYHVYLSSALGLIDDNDRDSEERKLYKLTLSFKYRLD